MRTSRATGWWLAAICICFLLRGWFYASMFPLWEGYDEFAHFGVVRAMALKGFPIVPRDQPGQRDVEESMKLVPVPWQWRGWNVFRASLTHDEYWALPQSERQARETRLRRIPSSWAWQDSTGGISAYEAAQPPLNYWLLAPALYAARGWSLAAQLILLRWLSMSIASLALPLIFFVARCALDNDPIALACTAFVALMPGFAIDAARVSNEPLAIVWFTLLTWLGLRVLWREPHLRDAFFLGAALGLGMLTKAYFWAAVPPVLLLLIFKYRKAWRFSLAAVGLAAALSGWWYIRNIAATGSLTAQPEAIAVATRNAPHGWLAIFQLSWRRAIDVILVSHLYYCGWSALLLRSWMYHLLFAIAAAALTLVLFRLRDPRLAWLAALYGFFWLAQLYNAWLQWTVKGLAGSMGWYLYAAVGCEVVLCIAAFGRWRMWAAAVGATLFAALDLYGMHWLAIPYYTGLIAHRANGSLAALHLSAYSAAGIATVGERLTANKPAWFSPAVFAVLWILYLCATLLPAAALAVTAIRKRR